MIDEIVIPDVGHSEHSVTVANWLVAEGDHVERGQALVEVETDKALLTIEAFRSGYLIKILAWTGEPTEDQREQMRFLGEAKRRLEPAAAGAGE